MPLREVSCGADRGGRDEGRLELGVKKCSRRSASGAAHPTLAPWSRRTIVRSRGVAIASRRCQRRPWQSMDYVWLREAPIESLYLIYMQPPLMNLLRAVALQAPGDTGDRAWSNRTPSRRWAMSRNTPQAMTATTGFAEHRMALRFQPLSHLDAYRTGPHRCQRTLLEPGSVVAMAHTYRHPRAPSADVACATTDLAISRVAITVYATHCQLC